MQLLSWLVGAGSNLLQPDANGALMWEAKDDSCKRSVQLLQKAQVQYKLFQVKLACHKFT